MKTTDEWHGRWINGPGGFAEFIRDVQNDAVAHARAECAAEIERLKAELIESRDETEGWIKIATDVRQERDEARGEVERLKAELATLREHQPPVTGPQEPAESPLDKAAREAFERFWRRKMSPQEWGSNSRSPLRQSWRRVVAPFVGVKEEPPKPPTDGELLQIAWRNHRHDHGHGTDQWFTTDWEKVAEEFLAKRSDQKNAKAPE